MGIDPQTHKPLDSTEGTQRDEEVSIVQEGEKNSEKSMEEEEVEKSRSFSIDDVPIILPEEMISQSSSSSSSSINSAKMQENQLPLMEWLESTPWWSLDDIQEWDLLWEPSEPGSAVDEPLDDFGSSILGQNSWTFTL